VGAVSCGKLATYCLTQQTARRAEWSRERAERFRVGGRESECFVSRYGICNKVINKGYGTAAHPPHAGARARRRLTADTARERGGSRGGTRVLRHGPRAGGRARTVKCLFGRTIFRQKRWILPARHARYLCGACAPASRVRCVCARRCVAAEHTLSPTRARKHTSNTRTTRISCVPALEERRRMRPCRCTSWQATRGPHRRARGACTVRKSASKRAPQLPMWSTTYLLPPSWRLNAGRLRCGGSRFFRPSRLRTRTTRWWIAASTL
jgi:hypothetical protein